MRKLLIAYSCLTLLCLSSSAFAASFLTQPYLQNVKTSGITIMWELDASAAGTVEYGTSASYGQSLASTETSLSSGTYVHKTVLTSLSPGTTYHYRVLLDGAPATGDRLFTTAPAGTPDFSFGVWSDSQGHNHGAYPADPYEPTKSFLAHMAAQNPEIAVTVGDLAEDGSAYSDTRSYYLDRVAQYLGQTVPWFNAWGNHDRGQSAIIRDFADMPSKDRAGYDAGWGSYSFDYAGCHFVCIDYDVMSTDVLNWLESDLQSTANQNAKFTFLFIHVMPYCELWIDGSQFLRDNLVPLMETYGVDVCFSGHTHEYERGYTGGIHYCITGGGSWLDFGEPIIKDWPHMYIGGAQDLPGYDHGLVNEYVMVDITGNSWTATMHAFNFDGSYVGVLDTFSSSMPDTDSDGLLDEQETFLGTNPNKADTDDDGLEDAEEVSVHLTDPTDADSDDDGLDDGVEVNATNGYATDPDKADTDGDGFDDGEEIGESTDPLNSYDYPGTDWEGFFYDNFESYADDAEVQAAGWQIVDANSPIEDSTWTVTNPGGRVNPATADGTASGGQFMISDSDAQAGRNNTDTGMSHDLITPAFSTSGASTVWLHADVTAQLNNNGSAIFDVDVSTNGGASWTNLFRRVASGRGTLKAATTLLPDNTNADGFYGRLDLDLSAYAANQPSVRVRLRHFEPTWDWFIAVDNVAVDNLPPEGMAPAGAELVYEQDFSSGTLGDMQRLSYEGNTGTESWHTTDKGSRYSQGTVSQYGVNRLNHATGQTAPNFAMMDSDTDPDPAEDEYLRTPALDLSAYAEAYVEFDSETWLDSGDMEQDFLVMVSNDGGGSWSVQETLFDYEGGGLFDACEEPFFAVRRFKLPESALRANVALAWHYESSGNAGWWAIDDIRVAGVRDTDHDGLLDTEETVLGTDPEVADSDGDGLGDGEEVNIFQTDPTDTDTDHDGLSDYREIHWDGNGDYTAGADTDPLNRDSDGDGVSDGTESGAGTNPLDGAEVPPLPLLNWTGLLLLAGFISLAALAPLKRTKRA